MFRGNSKKKSAKVSLKRLSIRRSNETNNRKEAIMSTKTTVMGHKIVSINGSGVGPGKA